MGRAVKLARLKPGILRKLSFPKSPGWGDVTLNVLPLWHSSWWSKSSSGSGDVVIASSKAGECVAGGGTGLGFFVLFAEMRILRAR